MDHRMISHYINKIRNSNRSLEFVDQITEEIIDSGHSHVAIEAELALILWGKNMTDDAFKRFQLIIEYEIENNYPTFNTKYVDSVATASSILLREYCDRTLFDAYDLFVLSYLYLTDHIHQFGLLSCHSYQSRALLIENCENYADLFLKKQLGNDSLNPFPLAISDYIQATEGFAQFGMTERVKKCFKRASYLQQQLDGRKLEGRDANLFSRAELTELGQRTIGKITSGLHPINALNKEKIKATLFY